MVLKFWKKDYLHLLLCPMNYLTYILMVFVLLHILLHQDWLFIVSLMNCCGPLMEIICMCSALKFISFLLINLLLILLSCIMKLVSLLFILFYCILKQMVICVGIFPTLTSLYIWKILISFPMFLHLHLLLMLTMRFFLLYLFVYLLL